MASFGNAESGFVTVVLEDLLPRNLAIVVLIGPEGRVIRPILLLVSVGRSLVRGGRLMGTTTTCLEVKILPFNTL